MDESVSVVVTCYNLERYIEQAVTSVLAQEYAGEIQLIVVDDASTDASLTVLDRISGIERVHLARNGGVMQATIEGLRRCRHDVVFFLDGDDVWHPKKVQSAMENFGPRSKLTTHDLWYMDEKALPISRETRVSQMLNTANRGHHDRLISECILHHRDYVWLGSAFGIRRSLVDVEGFIRFCESRPYLQTCYQDWPLAVWVASEGGGEMKYVGKKLFGYRLHGENYSGAAQTLQKRRRNLHKSLDTSRLIAEIVSARNCDPSVLQSAEALRMGYEIQLACAEASRWRMLQTAAANWKGLIYQGSPISNLLRLMMFTTLGGEGGNSAAHAMKRAAAAFRAHRG